MDVSGSQQSSNQREITRREMGRNLVALGIGLGALEAAAQSGDSGSALSADARQVLIERLTNTKYVTDANGNVDMLLTDAVWPGDDGGAFHQHWLLNPMDGFKGHPAAALQKSVFVGSNARHDGAAPGDAAEKIAEILRLSDELGLLDDDNLIYFVLKTKIHTSTHDALARGAREFAASLESEGTLRQGQGATLAEEYLSGASAMSQHNGY